MLEIERWVGEGVEHRVFRVPGFLSSRPNWVPPSRHPQASVAPPLWVQGGRHCRLLGKEWGTQFRRRDRHSGTHVHCTIIPTCIRGRVRQR